MVAFGELHKRDDGKCIGFLSWPPNRFSWGEFHVLVEIIVVRSTTSADLYRFRLMNVL